MSGIWKYLSAAFAGALLYAAWAYSKLASKPTTKIDYEIKKFKNKQKNTEGSSIVNDIDGRIKLNKKGKPKKKLRIFKR